MSSYGQKETIERILCMMYREQTLCIVVAFYKANNEIDDVGQQHTTLLGPGSNLNCSWIAALALFVHRQKGKILSDKEAGAKYVTNHMNHHLHLLHHFLRNCNYFNVNLLSIDDLQLQTLGVFSRCF